MASIFALMLATFLFTSSTFSFASASCSMAVFAFGSSGAGEAAVSSFDVSALPLSAPAVLSVFWSSAGAAAFSSFDVSALLSSAPAVLSVVWSSASFSSAPSIHLEYSDTCGFSPFSSGFSSLWSASFSSAPSIHFEYSETCGFSSPSLTLVGSAASSETTSFWGAQTSQQFRDGASQSYPISVSPLTPSPLQSQKPEEPNGSVLIQLSSLSGSLLPSGLQLPVCRHMHAGECT
mmetsp:Transcript_31055/g.60955  ORF Transcript_31055/g.60955 Transcript_31055/m.60955 type:complete len:234 (+) Transcript_31055:441-1142(+)